MSAYSQTYLYCDNPGCQLDSYPFESDYTAESIGQQRKRAAREGWTNKGAKDYCPRHSSSKGETT